MNKQDFADQFSLDQWQKLCQRQDFVEAFWADDFESAKEISKEELDNPPKKV